MADQLARLKGRFLLTLIDHPNARQVFGAFNLTEFRTTYSVGSKKTVEDASCGELIIANWAA